MSNQDAFADHAEDPTTEHAVDVRIGLKPDFLSDVLVTAFDGSYGACWYWARPFEPEEGKSFIKVQLLPVMLLDAATGREVVGPTMKETWTEVTIIEAEESDAATDALNTEWQTNERGEADTRYYKIDHRLIARGIQLAINKRGGASEEICATVVTAVVDNDAGAIDAGAADVIVQLGLFGQVVYG